MSLLTRRLTPAPLRKRRSLPGDPGRPLTRSQGWGRWLRIGVAIALMFWFTIPFIPLLLWAFTDRWAAPAPLPTQWGMSGVDSAARQGAVAAFAHSLVLAVLVALIATPLGALTARALVRGWAPFPRVLTALVFAPVVLPPFAAVLGVNVLLLRLHVPPTAGVVLVLAVSAIPYTTFAMRVAYAVHDLGYEEEARVLGASRRYVLWRVHLPLLLPALARSAFLAFLVGWSDYVVTVIVGGGQFVTVPLIIASAAAGVGNDSVVAVLSLSAIIPPILFLGLLAWPRRIRHRGEPI